MTLDLLTRGLFDYAGLFPPAELDWEPMLQEAASFDTALHRPGLVAADMVYTPAHWPDASSDAMQHAGFRAGHTVTQCLVGVPASQAIDTAHAIAAWNEARVDDDVPQRIISLEVHADELDDDLAATLHAARAGLPQGTRLFFEPKWDDAGWKDAPGCFAMLERLNEAGNSDDAIGIKFRAAGPTAVGAAVIADIIERAVRIGCPIKATQGLHHPFAGDARYHNVHGFLNVAAGLRMHQTAGVRGAALVDLIQDPEPASFVFHAGLGWLERRATAQQVAEAIAAVPFTIGSCSLAEPDGDLRELFG